MITENRKQKYTIFDYWWSFIIPGAIGMILECYRDTSIIFCGVSFTFFSVGIMLMLLKIPYEMAYELGLIERKWKRGKTARCTGDTHS